MILLYPNNELFALKIDLDAVKPLFLDAAVQNMRADESTVPATMVEDIHTL